MEDRASKSIVELTISLRMFHNFFLAGKSSGKRSFESNLDIFRNIFSSTLLPIIKEREILQMLLQVN